MLELAPNWLLDPCVVEGHCGGAVERVTFGLLFCRLLEGDPPATVPLDEPSRLVPPVELEAPTVPKAPVVDEAGCKPDIP
jgi:hypothetical protein